MEEREAPRANVLGVGISAINMEMALSIIEGWITRGERQYICLATVNGIMECQRDPALTEAFNSSGLTTPDGMPLVWLSRLHGFERVGRVYGPDLMEALCELSRKKGYRHYLYGGADGVAELLKSRLCERFPGLEIVGTQSPPFRPLTPQEDTEAVCSINEAEPDIVWIGLGSPKQDHWMSAHVGRIAAPVLIGVGAAFDFHAGRKKQAPRWMQRSGLEWLFRLTQEPGRLWWRYLVYNPLFVTLVLLQRASIKRYARPREELMIAGQEKPQC